MSTETANTTLPSEPALKDDSLQDQIIQRRIDRARFQVRLVEIATAATQLAVIVLVYLLVVTFIDHWVVGLNLGMRLAALILLVVACAAFVIRRLVPCLTRSVNPVYAARAIEQAVPSLKNSLINFLLLRSQRQTLRPVIFAGVQRQAAEDLEAIDVDAAVDRSDLIHVGYLLAALVVLVGIYKIASPKDPFQSVARIITPWKPIPRPSRVQITQVEPGSVEVYRGEVIEVTAFVDGLDEDESVMLRYSTEDGQAIDREIPLQQSNGGDPRYRAVLATGDFGIQEPLTYYLHAGDSRTEDYRVLLKDAPSITLQSILYQYPRYTQWADEKVTGQGDLKGLEGTQVRLEALANQPIRSAYLELFLPEDLAANSENPKPSKAVSMKFDGPRAWGQLLLALQPDRRTPQFVAYQIRFLNQEGQRNREPARFRIDVTPDLPPLVEVVSPRRRDLELAENDRLTIEIRALDPDFAIRRLLLQATAENKPILKQTLLDQLHQGPVLAQHEFVPRSLELRAGDVVLYQAIAEDNRTAIGSESPDPNRQQSEPYRIRIVAADPAVEEAANPESESGGPQEPQDGGEDAQSEDSGAAGQQATPSEAGEAGDQQQPSAEGQTGDQPGAETPAGSQENTETEGAEPTPADAPGTGDSTTPSDSTPSDAQSEPPPDGEAGAGQGDPSSAVPSDGSNDADAFERILEHLREQGEPSNDSSSESSPAEDVAGEETDQRARPSGDESAADADSASDAPDATGQPDETPSDGAPDQAQSEPTAGGEKPRPGQQESTGRGQDDQSETGQSPRPDRSRPRDTSGAGQQPADNTATPPSDAPSGEQTGTTGEESTTPPTDDSAEPPNGQATESEGRGQTQATPSEGETGTEQAGSSDRPGDATQSPNEEMTEGADPGSQSTPPSTAASGGAPSDGTTVPGGQPAAGEASDEPGPTAEEPPSGDDPNLQFAQEATDLALEHLRDQQQNTELLERLGWTPEQAAAFLKRWEQLRREANQQDVQGEQARQRLEDQLRGLGLRPRDAVTRRDVTNADAAQGLSEAGSRTTPPPEYRDHYRAFLRSFSRQDQED